MKYQKARSGFANRIFFYGFYYFTLPEGRLLHAEGEKL